MDLGIANESLRRWVIQADIDRGESPGLTTEERAELTRLRRENRTLRIEREILNSQRLLRQGDRRDPVIVFRFVERERATYPVTTMCRVLEVSPSGFWAWSKRPPSERARSDASLTSSIRRIHERSWGTYGVPRVHAELREEGTRCSRKRVARLMAAAGLEGVHRRRAVRTTVRDRDAATAPDLVNRAFAAPAPDRLWVADITYVPTWSGFLYVAVIMDACSRMVVGWSMAGHLRTELILDALDMAIARRRPGEGLVHHSDRGTQYTSLAFGRRAREAGISLSMGSTGDAFDNALAESFFASLETELLDRTSFRTRADARYPLRRSTGTSR